MNGILTEGILKTIIICATAVSLAFVAVYAYRIYKGREHDAWMYIFMSGVVLFFAVMIFSYAFRSNQHVLDFISLASALISIILAIITIIYSFYSNSRSSGQIDVLNRAAQEVKNATTTYSTSADSLQENIRLILEKIGQVEQKIDTKNDRQNKDNATANASGIIPNIDELKRYVDAGSFIGNLALLACVHVFQKNNNLNIKDLGFVPDDTELSLSSYMVGYIVSASALGIMTVRVEGTQLIISNVRFAEELKEKIISMVEAYIENNSPNQEAKQYNNDIYNKFKSIFNPESGTK